METIWPVESEPDRKVAVYYAAMVKINHLMAAQTGMKVHNYEAAKHECTVLEPLTFAANGSLHANVVCVAPLGKMLCHSSLLNDVCTCAHLTAYPKIKRFERVFSGLVTNICAF